MTQNDRQSGGKSPWYLYILECAGGRLYTGITVNIEARFQAHMAGKGAKFTRSYPPERILLTQVFADRAEASKAEYAIKKLTQAEKRELIGQTALAEKPAGRKTRES